MRWSSPLIVPLALALACGDGGSSDTVAGALDTSRSPSAAPQILDAGASTREVPCVDEQIAQLPLFDEPAVGKVTSEGEAGVFQSAIDATGGGLATSQGFVYARFTENGLEKVDIDDEAAFASTAWHVAFRRYVIRINSGVAGPSEVVAARTRPGTEFDALTAPPENLTYRAEQYYTDSCEYVPDTSGIGAPATVLSSFWAYSACLSMTRNVFVLTLPGGRHVKLQVIAYYSLENQQRCDEQGATGSPSGAGNLRVRWAFLD
ncbi:MAG: HmuY family protein [Polyangiales bacterium]